MAAYSAIPGFYGKLPILGDFVSRRLPRAFIDPWDQWLQSALAASREQLGAGWLEVYLTSPLWRFALSPGLCGESAWAGVLMPSVDKVGRYFPFTVAAPVARAHLLPYLFDSGSNWFDDLEDLALSGLKDGFKLDEFDGRLQSLAPPEFLADGASPAEAGGQGRLALQLGLASQKQTGMAFIGLSGILLREFLPTFSLWNTEGSRHIDPSLVICEGLPPADTFVALMTGQWQQRGWSLRSFSLPLAARRESPSPPDESARPGSGSGETLIQGRWRSCGITVAGKKRALNEDALIERPDLGLWAVADGMGGHLAGDVASRNIVEALAEVEPSADLEAFIERVENRLQEVNTALRQMAKRDGGGQIIGSTVVVLLAVGDRCAAVWAGDSRLYRCRAGKLEQLTRDHSLLDAMISTGLVSTEPSSAPGHCNVITRAVGADTYLSLDVERFELLDGDRFLLCSDGLDKELSNPEIEALMAEDDSGEAARALIERALERGARDNVTVIVVQAGAVERDEKEPDR
jgi:type VI secretion system protein ImpM